MKQRGKFKHWDFILLDFVSLVTAFCAAYLIRFKTDVFGLIYRHQIIIMILGFVLVHSFSAPYKNILKRGSLIEFRKSFVHVFEMAVINILCLFFIHETGDISRLFVGYLWVLYFCLMLIGRLILKKQLRARNAQDKGKNSAILIASQKNAEMIVVDYLNTPLKSYFFEAIFLSDYDSENSPSVVGNVPVKGSLADAVEFATHNWVDEATIYLPDHKKVAASLSDQFCMMGIKTHTVLSRLPKTEDDLNVQYAECIGNRVIVTQVQRNVPVYQLILKRGIDIMGSLVGCFITIILFLFIAPAIYIQSPGPIFYSSVRIGKNGKPFKMYKFRSMYMDADTRKAELMNQNIMSDGMMFKLADDPRIIGSEKKGKDGKPKGIGNFIRRTSIDEFPQFFSALIGDMSLCGTRPPTPDEYARYSAKHKARLALAPGITGLWQISGRSNITDFDEIVALDTEYIKTWDIWLDLKIIWKTIGTVIKGEGAA